jgi:Spy/CpxP family protein refolding chaperone
MLLTRKKLSAFLLASAALLCFSVPSFAQDWRGGPGGDRGGPMERSFRGGERGRWWDNPQVAQQIGITDDQKKKMDDIFQQHRLQLVDLNATLQKDEIILHPLIEADQPDESKVLSQIDTIAQARAELEKANARMLFDIRKVLTPDQWKKLQTMAQNRRDGMGPDGRRWDGSGRSRGGPNGSKGGPGDGPGSGPDGQQPPPPPQQPNE